MTFTRLTLGEPRLKGRPKGGPTSDCSEDVVVGSNIALDPGLETQLATTGGGPGGDEIPSGDASSNTGLSFSDGSQAPIAGYFSAGTTTVPQHPFIVSTTNPHSGTYHIRRDSTDAFASRVVSLNRGRMCDLAGDLLDNFEGVYSAIVVAGQVITFTFWHRISVASGIGSWMHWYDITGGFLDSEEEIHSSTTTYAQGTHATTVPASAHFVVVQLEGHAERVFDFDDFGLEVVA